MILFILNKLCTVTHGNINHLMIKLHNDNHDDDMMMIIMIINKSIDN